MSLKAELETWVDALKAYDAQDFEKALDLFQRIADSSKILANIGLIYATIGEHELAVENFNAATSLDQFLAVAYFQCGVSNFLLERFELAFKDFEEAYLYLRGNESIKYEQLGLKFTLYSAEVLFNRGLAQIYNGQVDEGLEDMKAARGEKVTPEHDVIDDAIKDNGDGYTVFSIPVGVLYRPAENKVKNTKAKDYLGKAKLVAATDSRDMYTTFTGSTRLAQGLTPSGAPLERPPPDDRRPSAALVDPPPKLDRSNTARRPLPKDKDDSPSPARNNSVSVPSRNASASSGSINAGRGGGSGTAAMPLGSMGATPSRSLSVRRPEGSGAPPPPPAKAPAARLTEIYDDYIGFTDDSPPPPLPTQQQLAPPRGADARIASWAQKVPATRGGAAVGTGQGRAASIAPTASMRRKPTRRPTIAGARSVRASTYDDEEEGYGSGEYDELPFELVKIRVKIHYREDLRGMAIGPEMAYDEFLERVTSKFGRKMTGLSMRFKDEDGGLVSLLDESDFELAIETARESARGKPEGKLEIWCEDA